MATRAVWKHLRSIRRAVRRLGRRQIKPGVASLVILRNGWGILHALIVVVLLLLAAAVVGLAMISGTLMRKLKTKKNPKIVT